LGQTFKLKFGHQGGNQPVKDLRTGKVAITAQNHGFAVDADSLPKEMEVTHINLNDGTVEGCGIANCPSSCAYHPEAGPARTMPATSFPNLPN
jgi:carbamoyl-phosphate synthase small subunit